MRRLTIKNTLISAILAVSMFAMVGCNTDYDVEFDYNLMNYNQIQHHNLYYSQP